MTKPQVSLVKCKNYEPKDVETAVKASVELLGGVGKFIRPQERVLIKPNLLTAATPEQGVDTHPEVIRAVIRLVKPVTKNIYCGDSPSVWKERQDIHHVYEASGLKKICQDEGVEMAYFIKPKMFGSYPLTEWLEKTDRLISIPKFKTHGFTILTAGIKNLFGLVVGMNKMKIHRDNPRPVDLSRVLIDLYEIRKPDLTILDGVTVMEGEGPATGGTLRQMGLIAASPDALAMDMVLARLMGISPGDIPTNKEALRRGLGEGGLETIELLGEELNTFVAKDFKLPQTTYLNRAPQWIINLSKHLLRMRPCVKQKRCRVCGLCQKGCPVQAISTKEGRVVIDSRRCILCLCCQEVCPYGAIELKKNFLMRLVDARNK